MLEGIVTLAAVTSTNPTTIFFGTGMGVTLMGALLVILLSAKELILVSNNNPSRIKMWFNAAIVPLLVLYIINWAIMLMQ